MTTEHGVSRRAFIRTTGGLAIGFRAVASVLVTSLPPRVICRISFSGRITPPLGKMV